MATFEKVKLSASTGGRRVKVAATSSAGTTIHATGISATVIDEVTLDLCNTSASAVTATVQWGGTTATDDEVKISLDPYEVRQYTGILHGDGSAGRTIAVYAGTTNVVTVGGWVNRITP